MATTRKKPTAAQLRARAAFSKIMKSGGFGAAKKRRKNPVGRSGASGRGLSVNVVGADPDSQNGSSKNPFGRQTRQLSGAKRRRKNPVGRSGASGRGLSTQTQADDNNRGSRDMNPRARRHMKTKPVLAYTVYEARHGIAGKVIGAFPTKPAAVQFARAWSDMKRCPALIQGRG